MRKRMLCITFISMSKQHYLYINTHKRTKTVQKDDKMNNIIKGIILIFKGLFSPITALFRFINTTVSLEEISSVRKRLDVIETLNERLESDVNFLSGKIKELIDKNNHKVITLNPDTIRKDINGLNKKVEAIELSIAHIENNLMYDVKPREIGKRLKRAEAEINKVKKTILYSEKYEITEQDIDTDLGNVKAEALGMKVAKEEKEQLRDEKYDWKREKKLVDNKIADDK